MEIFSLIDFHLTNTKTWVRNNTPPLWLEVQPQGSELTHRSRDKMAAISQTTFSTAFSWIKKYEFRYIFHWSVPKSPINNIPALVQIMAWRRPGDKPLSEPMMAHLLTHICVTRPQCVKHPIYCLSMNTNVHTVHVAMTISHLCPGSGHVSLMLKVQHSVLFPRPRKVTSSFYLVFPTLVHVCVSIFPSELCLSYESKLIIIIVSGLLIVLGFSGSNNQLQGCFNIINIVWNTICKYEIIPGAKWWVKVAETNMIVAKFAKRYNTVGLDTVKVTFHMFPLL